MAVDVEVVVDEHIARAGVDRRHERVVDVEVLDLGALVAKLTLEPEQAEIVAADDVDVIAGLELHIGDVVADDVGPGDGVGGEVHRPVEILRLREQDTALDPDIAALVAGRGRRGDRHRGSASGCE